MRLDDILNRLVIGFGAFYEQLNFIGDTKFNQVVAVRPARSPRLIIGWLNVPA